MVSNDVKESAGVLKHSIDGGVIRVEHWVTASVHEKEERGGYDSFEVVGHVCAAAEGIPKGAQGVVEVLGR